MYVCVYDFVRHLLQIKPFIALLNCLLKFIFKLIFVYSFYVCVLLMFLMFFSVHNDDNNI